MINPNRPTRFTEEDLAACKKLGRIWGPVQPLSRTAVIREALRRCLQAEEKKKIKGSSPSD
jgi:hypothetical protein